jgi:gamma-glutamylcyclotransferase (GGCT)/AIG2-like uncharacterized protein YtfP
MSPLSEENAQEITRLLAEGLDHYGDDAIGKAIQAWRDVLAIDPQNAEALDYIQTADRREQRRLPFDEQLSDTERHIVHESKVLIDKGDWEGALDLLRSTGDAQPVALEFQATLELVRSRLLRQYTERVGSLDQVPALRGGSADLTSYNLPSDAGFMISLIDGTTPLTDLISLSGMDAFEALRIMGNLLDAEIVELRP